ncbi:hypothetical protein [Streptosporangium canum]|uniref:hypothetical protein n=1 Tax=Streptosporangium canum TaxID=324952 RepID=UPI0033A75DE6
MARRASSAPSHAHWPPASAAAGDLRANWRAQCVADGVDAAAELAGCLHPGAGLAPRPTLEEIAAWIWRDDAGLTARTKPVSRADVLAAVADACPDGAVDTADVEALTDAVLRCGPAVRLPDSGASHLVNAARYTGCR